MPLEARLRVSQSCIGGELALLWLWSNSMTQKVEAIYTGGVLKPTRERQQIALDLITNTEDGVLLWQIACEFVSASRKLSKQGFTSTHAWNRRGVPGSAVSRVAFRGDFGPGEGASSHAGSIVLGCPDCRRVCGSREDGRRLRGAVQRASTIPTR